MKQRVIELTQLVQSLQAQLVAVQQSAAGREGQLAQALVNLATLPDFAAEENSEARKTVYLVTLPHPRQAVSEDGFRLVAPESLTKDEILERFLAACAAPIHTSPRSVLRGDHVAPERACVARECHQPDQGGEVHWRDRLPAQAPQFHFLLC